MVGGSLLLLVAATISDGDVILPPTNVTDSHFSVAVIMMQGAGISASAYVPLLQRIQEDAAAAVPQIAVWAGCPQVSLSTVDPVNIAGAISRTVDALKAKGMATTTPVFLMGHSLGGAMLELYAHDHPTGFKACVFMGAFISRSRRDNEGRPTYPLPTLTLAGELDGLARITRNGAEAFHAQVQLSENRTQASIDMGVVVLPGVSHMQYASGDPPALVKARDLMPEVTYDAAHAAMSTAILDFVRAQTLQDPAAIKALLSAASATESFVAPMVEALQLEGSPFLKPPCNSDFVTNPTCRYPSWPAKTLIPGQHPKTPDPLPPSDCTCGSPWVINKAHKMMAGLDQIPGGSTASIVSNDAFHDVSDVTPFHLAHIFNTCSAGAACVLNATTVDMLMFETLESEDTGFVSISAVEMRVKLKSREAFWQAAGVANVDSNATDLTGSRCKEINAAALAWAVSAAAPATMARYTKIGEPYVMGDDVNSPIGITGPTWIKKALQYNRQTNGPNGRSFVEVVSPRFFVKNKNDGNEPYTDPVGMHYCKLLSPARIMEWIYVDSLRMYDSLNNHTVNTRG